MSDQTADQFVEIWLKAIERYEQITGKKLEDLELKSLESVANLESIVEQRNGNMTEFRAKRETLFKVMRNALIPVELVANLAAGGASMAFPPSSLVFGAVTYLIGAAKGVSGNYDSIQDLMKALQDFTVRLKVYSREHISRELQLKLAEVLMTLVEILAMARKHIKRGRVLGFGRSIVLGHEKDIQEALRKLEALTKSEDLLVGAETHTEVARQGRTVDGISTAVADTKLEIAQGRAENREMHDEMMVLLQTTAQEKVNPREKIKKILRPSVYPQDTYKRLVKDRLPGTGEWIFEEKVFKDWCTEKVMPVLFIRGIPGAGKSFLSTNIISYFIEQYPQGVQDSAHVSICYFFFKDNNPETRSIHQALRDIAFQIYSNDAVYAKHVDTTCLSFEDIKTVESAWQKLFLDFFTENTESDSTAILILDGLDEVYEAERGTFLPLLQDVVGEDGEASRLRIALVGRPHLSDDIADALEKDTVPTISIDATKNSNDIANYVESSIKKSRILRKVSKTLQSLVVNTLTERANGMFLWVDLMMRELNRKNREAAIREALQKAPKGLNEMIQHVLEGLSESLSPEDADDLNELLAWVTCAQKPLSLGDLDAIIRYKSPTGDGLISLESILRKNYASFFLLTREDGLTTADLLNLNSNAPAFEEDMNDEYDEPGVSDVDVNFDSNLETTEVTFCHASIGDFFRDRTYGKVTCGEGPAIGVDIDSANIETMKTVIMLCVDETMRQKAPDHDFLSRYAAPLWGSHMKDADVARASTHDKQMIGPLLIKFCQDPTIIELWARHRGYDLWTGDYVDVFRKWIDDEELLSLLSQSDQDWVKSTSEKPVSIFIECAKLSAKNWLQGVWWAPLPCCWSVFGYRQRLDGVKLRDVEKGLEGAHVLEEAAEWAGYEKDASWHRRVAMAHRDASFLDEAQKHFETSLELDPKMWKTRAGIAITEGLRGNYEKAIEHSYGEIEAVRANLDLGPGDPYANIALTLEYIGDWSYQLGEMEKAYLSYREACTTVTSKFNSFAACMELLDDKDRHDEVIKLTKEVLDNEKINIGSTYLFQYVATRGNDDDDIFFKAARRAARQTGDLSYLIDKIREAIELCRQNRRNHTMVILDLCLASIYHFERISTERAIQIWEHFVHMTAAAPTTPLGYAQLKSTQMLAGYYFARARETSGLEQAQYVSSLESMAKSRGRLGETYKLTPSSIMLGLWYRLNGQSDEAKACFKVHVKQALQILSDDDPENDMEGYQTLACVLLSAGDEENAIALCQKMIAEISQASEGEESGSAVDAQKPDGQPVATSANNEGQVEADKSEEASQNNAADISVSTTNEDEALSWTCDGTCSPMKPLLRKDTIWLCRFCFDVGFCDDCIARVKADSLAINQCNPKHSWIPFKATNKKIPSNQILLGDDKLVDLEQWKGDLKKAWLT